MSGKLVKENKCLEELPEMDLTSFKLEILKLVYPIGQPYVTQENVNPATILGFGTWERVKGQVLVGYDENDTNFNAIGRTGGKSTTTITKANLPNYNLTVIDSGHRHTAGGYCYTTDFGNIPNLSGSGTSGYSLTTDNAKTGITVNSGGSGTAINNLQPYKVIGYMWIRTA